MCFKNVHKHAIFQNSKVENIFKESQDVETHTMLVMLF